jgi:uncharacterized protein (TIGR02231 family)
MCTISYSQNEIHIAGKPDKVIVYQSGANLSINLKAALKKGTNTVFIDSLPSNIDVNSIRLSSNSTSTVMSTDFMMEKINPNEVIEPKRIIEIKDSIEKINYIINDFNNKVVILQGEELILTSYKLRPESEKGSTIQDLVTFTQLYNKRMNEIKKEVLNIKEKQKEYLKILANLNKVIDEYNQTKKIINNFQIVALINSENTSTVDLELNFYTPDAGWIPNYEIKVKDVNSPAILSYKASVWQGTSRDWKDVQLVLSTRNPIMNGIIPQLYPWYLRLQQYKSLSQDDAYGFIPPESLSANSVRSARASDTDMSVDGMVTGTVENKYMTVEFAPSARYTIKSDNRQQSISLNEVEVPALYEYYCVPKLDTDAFLVAKISDWTKLNLLPGEALIYFDNTFIGKTNINPEVTLDTLTLSLGRDKSIVIKREIIKEMTETKFFSSNVVKKYGYLITVKNNRKSEINITIEDQFPISTNEQIEAKLLESSSAVIDNEKGFLKWKENVPSGKSIQRKFAYQIDSPQQK